MNIGLYFGSFNPIHIGHLIIANYVAYHSHVEQVWFIVSPQNPLKPSSSLLNEYHRLHLVRVATEGNTRIRVSDVEFGLPRPSYTIDTLAYLTEKYPQHSFSVIIGSDSYHNLPRWKNADLLLRDYSFLVYQRPGFEVNGICENVEVMPGAPLLDISSTMIRNLVKQKKSIQYLVSENVRKEIEENNYYK